MAGLAAGLFVGVARAGSDASPPASTQADAGLRAPSCALASLAPEAGAFLPPRERVFEGRLVLVDFWASWCPTCEHAFPFLDALARAHGGKGLEVVAVNLDSDPQDAIDFLAGRNVGFEIVHDPSGDCPRAFGLIGMPSSYLIDASGRIVEVTRGFRKGEARALRTRIEALLGDQPASEDDPALARITGSASR